MLTSWRLSRFKSAGPETQLEIAPLTVFAGPNSSGKSTVIQSMLLTAQTLQSPVYARPVVLNGHIARLGTFTDIVSDANEAEDILIGFQIKAPGPTDIRMRSYVSRYAFATRPRVRTEGPLIVDCFFTFSVRSEGESREIVRLQPLLEETGLSVSTLLAEAAGETIEIRRAAQSIAQRMAELRLPAEYSKRPEMSSLRYEVAVLRGALSRRETGVLGEATKAGASVVHFLPTRIAVVYDAVDTEASELVEALVLAGPETWHALEENKELINDDLLGIVAGEFKEVRKGLPKFIARRVKENLETLERSPSAELLLRVYQDLPMSVRGIVAQRLGDKVNELKAAARGGRQARFDIRYVPLPPLLTAGLELVREFFTSSVKYLGPLRDEPKPVYPLVGAADPGDVGFKGEHTAAVLDVHRNMPIAYVPSGVFDEARLNPVSRPTTLLKAVLDWLSYMGVGTQIETQDRGKLGHELRIATSDAPAYHDLTQVGVGVSQVLPILVLSLLADPGSTLIFEQPELHLHPRVQTRLADFFVSMTQLGKQCVVETHSEYLINRLRYLAAVSHGKGISDSVIIYFVEKGGARSTYTKVRIDEYGTIPNWPRGFFDESEELAAEVLRAGMEKRRLDRETK